ncbi:hypothetical protein GUJ93_ZPchr0014g47557 [Zizania palustris]|uniref:Uncharacterized protein n=1 Tax=Zizania palustris TaxID=103762 RepID=A0A8J5W6T5_ZIZPA|nr:hypothetical protein GUJ93_ZPchr0014g47557 [Zizania palustris]
MWCGTAASTFQRSGGPTTQLTWLGGTRPAQRRGGGGQAEQRTHVPVVGLPSGGGLASGRGRLGRAAAQRADGGASRRTCGGAVRRRWACVPTASQPGGEKEVDGPASRRRGDQAELRRGGLVLRKIFKGWSNNLRKEKTLMRYELIKRIQDFENKSESQYLTEV